MARSPRNGPAHVHPRFTFHVGQPTVRITSDSRQWQDALPLSRQDIASPPAATDGEETITYGDYFSAVGDYIAQNVPALIQAAEAALKRQIPADLLADIEIHLVKHGAFYHPAMLLLPVAGEQLKMVINVAVSEAGRERLCEEAGLLDFLYRNFPDAYIPALFGVGSGRTGTGRPLPMFAAQWLNRYYEFHRTAVCDAGKQQRWAVWDTDKGPWQLTERQTAQLFQQAAFILTYYFDPHTLGTIRQWHHAAGDFVVRRRSDDIDVRLITVRRYAPLIRLEDDESIELETLLDALTLFFLQTATWLRIDRLDGVGDLVWADGRVLAPIWRGFVQGVEMMAKINGFPTAFINGVVSYLSGHSAGDLMELGSRISKRYPVDLPEADLIKAHLQDHAEQLAVVMKN